MSNARKLADNLPSEGQLSGRNLMTNGSMSIDQRNSGSAVTPTSDQTYTLDRFQARLNNASKYSVQQVTDAPSGYYKSLKVTSAAATTVGTNDFYQINTPLEGYSVTQLDLGLSTAKKFTLSFWVKSSLTGTFGGAYSNNQGDRLYAWTYTISSANTWEHKTITVDGVTDGSWQRTNGAALWVYWTLGAGSGVQTTAGAWGTTFKRGPTGATNVVATNGATWQITGVQLEVGPQSTPFEHEPKSVTLAKCQRYFQHHQGDYYTIFLNGTKDDAHAYLNGSLTQVMRAKPSFSTANCYLYGRPSGTVTYTATENRCSLGHATIGFHNVSGSIDAGEGVRFESNNSNGYVRYDAEL